MSNNLVYQLYKSKYYVYEHYLDGKLFYIGKGTKLRALNFDDRNYLWKAKVKNRLHEVDVKIIRRFDDSDSALKFEGSHIKEQLKKNELVNILSNEKREKEIALANNSISMKNNILKKMYNAKRITYIRGSFDISNIVRKFNNKEGEKYKGVIYIASIKQMKNIRNMLNKHQYKSLLIWSLNNIDNIMSKKQQKEVNKLLSTNKIPDKYDFVIVNDYLLLKRFVFKDERINLAIINTSNVITVAEAMKYLIGKDVLEVCYKEKDKLVQSISLSKEAKAKINKYINKPLTTEDKNKLCEELNVINKHGKLTKWPTIKKMLEESGYEIQNRKLTIERKRRIVSIIKIK